MKDLEITIGCILSMEQGNIDRLSNLLAEDAIFCGPVPRPLNKCAFLALIAHLQRGFPNWKLHFRKVEVDGPFVRMIIEATGAHLRTLHLPGMLPHLPTGESFHLPPQQIEFYLECNKIRRIHLEPVQGGWIDGIMDQLEIPYPTMN